MCGEKVFTRKLSAQRAGSPPRVRGEVAQPVEMDCAVRITPACAGRSCTRRYPRLRLKDHPRVCGEKPKIEPETITKKGSPPRVRGEGIYRHAARYNGRITPACAGRSRRRCGTAAQLADHPRVCGEKSARAAQRRRNPGSPPRVRGEVQAAPLPQERGRITPACAGRRQKSCGRYAARWDHPRVCGEKYIGHAHGKDDFGSPPRVRGEDCVPAIFKSAVGITPACAGRSSP